MSAVIDDIDTVDLLLSLNHSFSEQPRVWEAGRDTDLHRLLLGFRKSEVLPVLQASIELLHATVIQHARHVILGDWPCPFRLEMIFGGSGGKEGKP